MLYVCVRDVMDVVFSVCIVRIQTTPPTHSCHSGLAICCANCVDHSCPQQ